MKNAEVQNLLYYIAKIQHPHDKNLTHAVFFMPHVGTLMAQTSANGFDVAKKMLLSENTYDILTRAGPKTPPKKSIKKLV